MTKEAGARIKINELLKEAGWRIKLSKIKAIKTSSERTFQAITEKSKGCLFGY